MQVANEGLVVMAEELAGLEQRTELLDGTLMVVVDVIGRLFMGALSL